jgi:dipeptidase E
MERLFLASTSTVHGKPYLEYCTEALEEFFEGVPEIVFIPYARPGGISYDEYTEIPAKRFKKLGINVKGIHTYRNPREAIAVADAIFIGGGNSFMLLEELHAQELLDPIRLAVRAGTPYLGTSAGTNVAGRTINTTNDMPIIMPTTFEALNLVNYNFNPHYIEPDQASTHRGETRETRIKEFHAVSDIPVLGLREGSWVEVKGKTQTLRGGLPAKAFEAGKKPKEIQDGATITLGSR